jgi:GT2 family glycosyltransferase
MCWINSDDLLLPGALNTVVDYFNRNPEVDVLYGNRLLIDRDNKEIGRWILPKHDDEVLTWVDFVPQETLFWRRDAWEKSGGQIDESFHYALDWDLLIRFRDSGANIKHIPEFLGAFRVHENQKTSMNVDLNGREEMSRIRRRILGRVPTQQEIQKRILPYICRHIFLDLKFRIGRRLFGGL